MKKSWNIVKKDLWIILLDIIAVNLAYYLALLIRFFVNVVFRPTVSFYLTNWSQFTPFYTVICIIVFFLFKLYGGLWTYVGLNDMNRIVLASAVTTVIQIVGTCIFVQRMPITYYIIGSLLQFVFIALIRFSYRILLAEKKKLSSRSTPTVPSMVIGAGETARKAIHYLEDTPFRATVIADEKNAGKTLDGIKIVSDYSASLSAVRAVFIADPGLSAEKRKEIKEKCDEAGIELQDYTGYLANLGGRIPASGLLELVNGKMTLVIDGNEKEYQNGEEALKDLKDRYDIKSISEARIELEKPSSIAYAGFEAWAEQHKKQTGEDVSFF